LQHAGLREDISTPLHTHTPTCALCVCTCAHNRCQETLGEDPYLTSRLGATVVKAFQDGGLDDGKYLQVIATAKHFDVHGGPVKHR